MESSPDINRQGNRRSLMTSIHRHIICDTSGASVAIALAFFLICAIIGSIVVTAASVNAKAVQTQQEMQQAEFTVGSAAQTVGSQLASAKVVVVSPSSSGETATIDANTLEGDEFAQNFWTTYGDTILESRAKGNSFSSTSMSVRQETVGDVYARLSIDKDLNITVDLSLDQNLAADSPHNTTVFVQCIPTYGTSGDLLSFSYEQPVIRQTGGAT